MKKMIIVDLDGTLIKKNTFHQYMLFIIYILMKKTDVATIISIFYYILCRMLRKIPHSTLKKNVLNLANKKISYKENLIFVEHILKWTNTRLVKFMKSYENSVCVLATAAPDCYATIVAKKFGFDYCIATSNTINEVWEENIREKKRNNVYKLCAKIGNVDPYIIFTDHYDDLPTMKVCQKTVLVNPSETTLMKVNIEKIDFSIL